MLRLEPMSRPEFQASVERAIPRHASDSARRGRWTEAAALEASQREFAELLPQGFDTPAFHFCTVVNEADGAGVGETWYRVQERGGKLHFWVDWIWIDPPFRRRGYASEVLLLLAGRAASLGADRIGLSVADDNTGAKALYAKLGFKPWSAQLMKELPPAAASSTRANPKP
ncbi:MAG: GNAT family N-acetyltransferase, partial [Thermoplasmata archaeon]|nr:GNAT family N-acetyltransferase [Thermoplasmata archaeon]